MLYPEIEPYECGYLDVGDGHSLYYEQCGSKDGKPVVFLHGGPGLGCLPDNRRFFNPEKYRIVLFDQRGAGRSRPHGSLHANTTWRLVEDIEALRWHLTIGSWQVFGGSWGSTLALAYAQAHSSAVSEIILRGIFLLRHFELQWFYQQGASLVFPDRWRDFLKPIPESEHDDLLVAYHRRLTSNDESMIIEAARAWSKWEAATSELRFNQSLTEVFDNEKTAYALARIEAHYFVNRGFFDAEDQLLANVAQIRNTPAAIVQGRYDMVTPMKTAWDLHKAWPEAEFHVIPDAGHSAYEAGMTDRLVRLTDQFAEAS